MLGPKIQRAVMDSIRARPLVYQAYLYLAWYPHSWGRRFVLGRWCSGLLRDHCLFVGAGARARPTATAELPAKRDDALRICCISDTHTYHDLLSVPEGDVLLHCGDVLRADRGGDEAKWEARVAALGAWLRRHPHRRKLVTGGNHDATLERLPPSRVDELLGEGVDFLSNEGLAVDGVRLFVSPYSMPNNKKSPNRAFQGDAVEAALEANLRAFREEGPVDVLVTHGPPAGVLDAGLGSGTIQRLVEEAAPRFHVFGHQHNAFGSVVRPPTTFLNVSNTDGLFALVKPATVFDVVARGRAPAAASDDYFDVDLLRGVLRPRGAATLPPGHL